MAPSSCRGEAVVFELETGITSWRRRLEGRSSLSPRELDELEDHLRARVDLELELNPALAPHRALLVARERLGASTALAKEFTKAGRPRWRYLLLAGWAMYGASLLLPVAGPAALQTVYAEVPWSAPAHHWPQQALADGWILPLIPNLAMAMTLPALLCSWRSRARWLTWTIGAFGVSALGFGVANLLDRSAVAIAGEIAVYPYLGLGYWTWSGAHVLVAAALLLRSREWTSARSRTRRARNA